MEGFNSSLLVIIVLYKKALDESETFQSLLQNIGTQETLDLFVYDNSPSRQAINEYTNISIEYTHDKDNAGLSTAYNEGVEYALKRHKDWVLLLDQDTVLPFNILRAYKGAIQQFPKIKMFAPILLLRNGTIFSPCRYRFKRGFHLKAISEGLHSLFNYSPVNSGIMVSVRAFTAVGGYNSRVRLDFSDFQFIERFRKIYPEFYVLDVYCTQNFSNEEPSLYSQAIRFRFFCDGALHADKNGIWDSMQYLTVVFLRALRLTFKYRKTQFIATFFSTFFTSSGSKA